MKFLVTGGCGFLGSHLCEILIRWHGHEVICADSGIIGTAKNVSGLLNHPLFRLDWCDINQGYDPGPVEGIFHLASPTAPAETYKHPEETLKVNTQGTIEMIRLANKYKAKLVFASSVKVKDSLTFGAAYIQGKAKGEEFCEEAKFPKIARMGNIYGPKMAPDDSRVIPTFCRNIRDGKPLEIWGDGQQVDSFCYATDAVHGLIKLMESDLPGVFELGSPDGITIYQLAMNMIRIIGKDTPILITQPGSGAAIACTNNMASENNRTTIALHRKSRKVPNIALAQNYLRWKPSTTLEDGIKKTYEYYCSLGG